MVPMTEVEILDRLATVRTRLINRISFIGGLSIGMPVELQQMKHAAATDGVKVYFNPDRVPLLSRDGLLFVYAHEVLHKALLHPWRRGTRKPGKWNRAADYRVNADLIREGLNMPSELKGLYDPMYADMSTEEIYDVLPDDPDDDQFDDCMDAPPEAGSEMEAQIEVMQAARAAKMMGDKSLMVERVLGEATDTVVNYYSLMRRFMMDRAESDDTFSRPNRRFVYQNIYLPTPYSEEAGDMGVGVDTSASIVNKELGEYFRDIDSIVADVRPRNLWVFYCDSSVKRVDCFKRGDRVVPNPKGGGGTSFVPVFEEVERRNINLKCLVYFTDMEGRFPSAPPPYPVMWLTKSRHVAPFGETVRIR